MNTTNFTADILYLEDMAERMSEIVDDVTDAGAMEELKQLAEVFQNLEPYYIDGQLVRGTHLNEYIKGEFTEIVYGVDFDELPYSCINWDDVTEKRTEDTDEVEIGDTTYYYFS
jgi:hypothetical protein